MPLTGPTIDFSIDTSTVRQLTELATAILVLKLSQLAHVGERTALRLVRSLGIERAEALCNRLADGMSFDDAIAGMGWPLESDFAGGEPPPLENPNPCHSCKNYVGLRGQSGDTLHCGMHPYGVEKGASGEYLKCEDWESR